MPEIRGQKAGDGREIMIARAAGSAAAFALLVMWMTPPTTPHASAPSPLLAYQNIRSDAPTLDAAAESIDYAAAAIPWWSLRAPQPARRGSATAPATDPAAMASVDEAEGTHEDMPSAGPDISQPAPATPQQTAPGGQAAAPPSYQPQRKAWAETVSTRTYQDEEAQEAAAEAGE